MIRGRPEAAAEIWTWRTGTASTDPSNRTKRLGGLLRGGVAMAIGALLYRFVSAPMGAGAIALGSIVSLAALLSPGGLYAGIERLFSKLGAWTARAISWTLLVPVFLLFFAPFGRVFRRGRRDRMKSRLEPTAESYWEAHAGPTAASADLERQY